MDKGRNSNGITLIALVVTIVVLIILATISVNIVMNGGLINKSQSGKELHELQREKERLELIKGDVVSDTNHVGKVTVDTYVEELINQGITVEEEVTDNGDGSKTVITDTGYSVTIEPNGENDIKIIIDGKAGALPPRIVRIDTTTTETSFTAKAVALRATGIKYYYKLDTEGEDGYKEIVNINAENEAEVTGLLTGTTYHIKAIAQNANGEVESKANVTTTKIMVEKININKAEEKVEAGNTVTLTVTIEPINATNKNVTWISNNEAVATVTTAGVVTGKKVGTAVITAEAVDGSNKTATCTVTVEPGEVTPTTPAGTQVKKPDTWTSEKVIAIADGKGGIVPLPNGYYYVGGNIDTGLVISDKEGDTMNASGVSMGSQFVWIPMANESDFPADSYEPYSKGYSTETSEYNTMKTQVLKYGGFFMGRFEAGVNSIELRTATTTAQAVVSKRGVAPYNWVPWGKSISDVNSDVTSADNVKVTTPTKGAVYLAKNMYTHPESVTSTLCYECQWEAMCNYIGDSTRTTPKKSAPELTGKVTTDVSKNIYDLAGNCTEWMMKATDSGYRRVRGGAFDDNYGVDWHGGRLLNSPRDYIVFRLIIYVK